MQMAHLQNVFVQAYDRMHALVQRNAKKNQRKNLDRKMQDALVLKTLMTALTAHNLRGIVRGITNGFLETTRFRIFPRIAFACI